MLWEWVCADRRSHFSRFQLTFPSLTQSRGTVFVVFSFSALPFNVRLFSPCQRCLGLVMFAIQRFDVWRVVLRCRRPKSAPPVTRTQYCHRAGTLATWGYVGPAAPWQHRDAPWDPSVSRTHGATGLPWSGKMESKFGIPTSPKKIVEMLILVFLRISFTVSI